MGWARSAPLAIAMVMLSPAAMAQTSSTPPSPTGCGDARNVKLDGVLPFAGATISYALDHDCFNIVLYRLTPKLAERRLTGDPIAARRQRDERSMTGPPHFYARIGSQPGYPRDPAPPPAMWADQMTCPALLPAIEALERAMAPKFAGDGPVRGGSMSVTMDGAGVEVWAGGLVYPSENRSHKFQITFNTNLDTPTADWVEKTLSDLKPCLSAGVPALDPPVP
jgi:hypothetical protein